MTIRSGDANLSTQSSRVVKITIRDTAHWPRTDLGLAGQMIREQLGDSLCADISDAELVLLSCGDCAEGLTPLRRIRTGRCGQRSWAPILIGGMGALSPGALGERGATVVLGDYRRFLSVLLDKGLEVASELPNVYHRNQSDDHIVEIDHSFPWHEAGKQIGMDDRYGIYLSRGCKRRCAFCQVGWAQEYSEHPEPDSIPRDLPPSKINYITNALSEVSFADSLPRGDFASDSFDAVRGRSPLVRMVRIGVEGISERLRRAVGKPISNEDLVNVTCRLQSEGRDVKWFLIAGLPGERADDWLEFRDTLGIMI